MHGGHGEDTPFYSVTETHVVLRVDVLALSPAVDLIYDAHDRKQSTVLAFLGVQSSMPL
eukprot:CAMPEP_0170456590 /NCGR_PEP_ID=MMETSP0123-20130129/4173_1 /TAXON_ID=182087 /ORGANISM="Favella ehrenbergii, Strain Fehren 1" /LENGTH=58 /DNA_ID=CAMNT_0010720117 /DNA_START=329 /DNA_END=505 /DNA_ORIENTATION=-